ncbi:SURF1 family protein [Methylobacterium durans]|uniref:SURF1 family protein n=1 Tax=Methylobacterium durans TaxID=2202825 RepID=UPI002AFE05FD|nr:SURF1 family protein [Methylobacterium durans]MEA1830916.1 SURF1 family protein [Methylobacterium durans]
MGDGPAGGDDRGSPDAPEAAARHSRGVLAAILVGAILAFTLLAGLGTWQLQRRAWKLDLIAHVDARLRAPPTPPPPRSDWPQIGSEDAYRRLRVAGTLLHDRETLVQAVTEAGAGAWVMTPLRQADGGVVLINRGFVPDARRDPARRPEGQIPGETIVTGLLRLSEPGGAFLRTNDPAAGRWFSRDVPAIAAASGLTDAAPYFIDADAARNPGGLPVGGLTVVAFRNDHLVYAITWYALALMVAGATIHLLRDTLRRPTDP